MFGKKDRKEEDVDSFFDENGNITSETFDVAFPQETDDEGFLGIRAPQPQDEIPQEMKDALKESVSNPVNEVKMLPFVVTTDSYTAVQLMQLLEMVRYCMEQSEKVIDSQTGESKEFELKLKVRNRGKSKFLISIGNESLPPIPQVEEFRIGN